MPKNLVAERDALLKALEVAHHRINAAQKGLQAAEEKARALETQAHAQETQLESMHRMFERRAAEIAACEGHGEEQIQVLEHKIGQGIAENQRLKTLLFEAESALNTDHGQDYLPAPKRGVHHEPDADRLDPSIEIEAAPPSVRRRR